MPSDPIGAVLLLAAPLGVLGVFALALTERLVPVLPSSGLFTAIGIAAAEGLWCLPVAVLASVIGSGTGAFGTYQLGIVASRRGEVRFRALLHRRDRWGRTLRAACRKGTTLPFTAQLIPATRIFAPLLGGVVRSDRRRFLLATAAGLTLWNLAFIIFGFAVARLGGSVNATLASLALVGSAACASLAWRFVRARPSFIAAARKPATHASPSSRSF